MNTGGGAPETATVDDVFRLAITFAAAFSDDPITRWPMPEASQETLEEVFRIVLLPYVEDSVVWKIQGCKGGAAWWPPGALKRYTEIEQATLARIRPLTTDNGARYEVMWDWIGAHVPESCWYLDMVAVSPEAQRHGLGRRLVSYGIERARADGCPAFLETGTARNVPFYESLGFETVDRESVPNGGPMIWFMQTPSVSS